MLEERGNKASLGKTWRKTLKEDLKIIHVLSDTEDAVNV